MLRDQVSDRTPPPGRKLVVLELAGIAALSVVVAGALHRPIASALRAVFDALSPNRALAVLGLVFLAAACSALVKRPRPQTAGPPWVAWPLAVGGLAGTAGVVWYSLGRATLVPQIFGDELTHGAAARNLALHGVLPARGYGFLTPVVDAAAYLVTSNDYTAFRVVQAVNVGVVVSAAFLAYRLAVRVLPARPALVAAGLSVVLPWLTYARFVMTEADFYPVFLLFALALVRALECPTPRRQLFVAAALALAYLTRTQALVLAGAVVVSVPLHGRAQRRTRSTLRAFAPTWALYAAVAAIVLAASISGVWSAVGPYRPLLQGFHHPHGLAIWFAANLAALALGLGVLVGIAAPLGIADLLSRPAAPGESALAAVTVASTLMLVLSVSLLSVSVYGQGSVHERDLFFAAPLLVACALAWATRGFARSKIVFGLTAAASIGLAAWIPRGAINAHSVDALSFKLWARLGTGLASPAVWIVVATAAGAVVVGMMRSMWPLVATVLVAAVGVAAASDYRSAAAETHAGRYVWVDRTLPSDARVTVLYVGYPRAACARPGAPSLAQMSLYTEYFNARVSRVGHLLDENGARGVSSTQFRLRSDGVVTRGARPLRPAYVVTDSRLTLDGARVASLPATTIAAHTGSRDALTLWRIRGPLRVLRPAALQRLRALPCS